MSSVRRAGPADAADAGRLLHEFNAEFGDRTPGAEAVADRMRELLPSPEIVVLLAGEGPSGIAVLRFRPAIFSRASECYLQELYVRPPERGKGIGRALMEAALEAARSQGADYIDLGTSEDDVAARGLYESLGFSNREGRPDGPVMYFYERQL